MVELASITQAGRFARLLTLTALVASQACLGSASTPTPNNRGPNNVEPDADGGSSPSSDGGPLVQDGGTSEIRGVSVLPKVARVDLGGTMRFSATVVGGNQGVRWSVQEGATGGSIDASGDYRAPSTSGVFHVVATSVADGSHSDSATVTVAAPAGVRPALQAGVWTDITPVEANVGATYGAPVIELDPTDPATLYMCVDANGLWKSTDAGSTWRRLGDPNRKPANGRVYYLDSPIWVRVDPRDPQHLIATQGVRGATLGFWVSRDGGESWRHPTGYEAIAKETTLDVTSLAIDPTDFDHILLGSHQAWPGGQTAGILESSDGGESWTKHPAQPGWSSASAGLHFLYEPSLGIGNSQTWLTAQESGGWWRTSDGGTNWTRVTERVIAHGGNQLYYTKEGVLYAGSHGYPLRSRDNGQTWETIESLPYATYYSIHGDGKTLYTQISYTGDNAGQGLQPWRVSAEDSGNSWTPYQGGAQTFNNGPFIMRFDANNGIMYSANWRTGVWALKVLP